MLTSFLVTAFLLGMFMSYVWSSKGFANLAIKMAFTAFTLWAAVMVILVVVPQLPAGIRLL